MNDYLLFTGSAVDCVGPLIFFAVMVISAIVNMKKQMEEQQEEEETPRHRPVPPPSKPRFGPTQEEIEEFLESLEGESHRKKPQVEHHATETRTPPTAVPRQPSHRTVPPSHARPAHVRQAPPPKKITSIPSRHLKTTHVPGRHTIKEKVAKDIKPTFRRPLSTTRPTLRPAREEKPPAPTTTAASAKHHGGALERISRMPLLKQAVVFSELLGPPIAVREEDEGR